MREGWKTVQLQEVCEKIQDGAHHSPKKTYPSPASNLFPYVTSKNIRNDEMLIETVTYVDAGFHSTIYSRCNAELGDVLLTKDGANTGNVCINEYDEPISLLSSVCLIKTNRYQLIPRFLLYYIQSDEGFEQITGKMTGAAIKRIILKTIKTSTIPLPPLTEQKRIVAILDEAFEGIDAAVANTAKNLANARELFESYLNAVFTQKGEGWVERTLGNTCIVGRGSSPRPIKQYITDAENGVSWIKIGDTKGITKYIRTTKQKITPEGATRSRRVDPGDFILTNSMTYGKPYVMATTGYIHDGWFVLRLNDDINSSYFYYLLSSRVVQEQFASLAAGAIVKNISSDLVKRAVLPIAPFSNQEQIAKKTENLNGETQSLEAKYRQKLDDLAELKQSILQKAFSGELSSQPEKILDKAVA